MTEPLEFSKDQDRLLLQEAVTVQPFSKGKGQGWKMIASKLTKSNQFPVVVKAKAVRERILQLMEDYSQNESTQDYVGDSQDEDINENLQQLVVLRDEAVKIATQSRSLNSIEMEQATSDKRVNLEADQEVKQPQHLTTKSVGEDSALNGGPNHREDTQESVPEPSGLQSKAMTGPDRSKRKMPSSPTKRRRNSVTDGTLCRFLEEREAKRLKLREEELALRREELEERKRLVKMVEERLEEEKKIREDMFKLMNGVLKK